MPNTITQPPLLTRKGRETLGKLIRYSRRDRLGISMDSFCELIKQTTGQNIKKPTISELERGNVEPTWNTLATLAASGLIVHPQSERPFTTAELFEIASEQKTINF